MTTSMSEHMDRESGPQVTSTGAPSTSKIGSQAPPPTSSSGTAGDGANPSRQFTAHEAVALLARAVKELHETGRATKAAGVSAYMRRLDPTFSQDRTPFAGFRNIIDSAVADGLITSERGASDFELKPAASAPPGAALTVGKPRTTLRPDLWRALLDWTPNARHGYNRRTRITSTVEDPLPADMVRVPSVSRDQRVVWMTAFTQEEPDLTVRSNLLEGLGEDDPASGFMSAVRSSTTLERRWKRALRGHIIARADEWANDNEIQLEDIYLPARQTAAAPVKAVNAGPTAVPTESTDGDDLRERILATLSILPLHELLKLRVPLEYTLR